ncbi:hypothetical protein RB195_015572 [Necator americanus]
MGLGCLIYAQRNEHIRMHLLRFSGSGNEHDGRLDSRAGQEKRGACKIIEDVVKKIKITRLRAHFFNITVLSALAHASQTWAFRNQEENAVMLNWESNASSIPPHTSERRISRISPMSAIED